MPGRPDHLRGGALRARLQLAAGIAALTVPAMVLAHLLVAGTAPPPGALAVAVLLVLATVVLLGRGRDGSGGAGRLLVAVSLAQLGGHSVFAASSSGGCLPVMGRGAELGLRLALLRPDATCPQGTLAVTGTATTSTSVVLGAVIVVLAHLVTGGLGTALVLAAAGGWRAGRAVTSRAAETLARLAGVFLVLALDHPGPAARRPSPRASWPQAPRPFPCWIGRAGVRRGPPVPVV